MLNISDSFLVIGYHLNAASYFHVKDNCFSPYPSWFRTWLCKCQVLPLLYFSIWISAKYLDHSNFIAVDFPALQKPWSIGMLVPKLDKFFIFKHLLYPWTFWIWLRWSLFSWITLHSLHVSVACKLSVSHIVWSYTCLPRAPTLNDKVWSLSPCLSLNT